MKTTFFLLLFTIVSFLAFGQDDSGHMKFKGVPIDGTLKEYIQKMERKGFIHMDTQEGIAMLRGDFAAYKNCMIGVATLKQKDLVSKITVIFPVCDTWSSLSSNYFSLKDMLTEKYGEPSDCIEKFQTDLQPDDDNSKMYLVQFDKCKYQTTYETKNGDIQLSISHDGVIRCFVMLAYFDKINSEIIKAEAMNDL